LKGKCVRKCVGCNSLKNREDLIKITKKYDTDNVIVNPNSQIFGRSVYLCYNKSCIEQAFKKNRLQKMLKCSISADLKGQLDEFGKY